MTRIRFDTVAGALPPLAELRPVLDLLLERSSPDSQRRWAASSELDTADARLIDVAGLVDAAQELANREAKHLADVYRAVLSAVACFDREDRSGAAEALLEAAALEQSRNRFAQAEAYAQSAAGAARGGADPRLLATTLRRQARAARARGRLADAERLYANGHELARVAHDPAGAAEGAIGVGNVLEEQGRWAEAEEWYERALELLDQDEGPRPEQWHALLNLSVVMRSLGRLDESVTHLRRAQAVADALGDPTAAPLVHNAWGQWHMAEGDFTHASERFRQALASEVGAWARVNFRLNLAEALLAGGQSLDAAEEAREAERDALMSGIPAKLPEVYRILGRIATARGNADSFVLFERALRIVGERGLPPIEEAVTLQAYADMHEAEDPERAEALRERAQSIYSELGVPGLREPWAETFGLAQDVQTSGPEIQEDRHDED